MKHLLVMIAILLTSVNANAASLQPANALSIGKVLVFAPASIAISTTTSLAISVQGLSLVGIQMPAAFTGTAISFLGSFDGILYQAVYTSTSGTALSYTVAAAHYVAIDPKDFYGFKFIKLVSGSTEAAARSFSVALKGL